MSQTVKLPVEDLIQSSSTPLKALLQPKGNLKKRVSVSCTMGQVDCVEKDICDSARFPRGIKELNSA